MKKLIITLGLLMAVLLIYAQENEGTQITRGKIIYEQVSKLDIQLEGDAAEFADMLPTETKSRKMLIFTPETTLYENAKGGGKQIIR